MKFQLLVGASVAALLAAGSAQAADKLKVGVLATLEGTYTVLGEDGVRGVKTALAKFGNKAGGREICLLYTSPSPRDLSTSRMPSSA